MPTNEIKLEKSYHTKFISPGWSYEPGKEIEEEADEICRIVHICNDLHLPMYFPRNLGPSSPMRSA